MIHTGELGKSWKSTEEMFERHFFFLHAVSCVWLGLLRLFVVVILVGFVCLLASA